MNKVVCFGAGGHAQILSEILIRMPGFEIITMLEIDDLLDDYISLGAEFFCIGLGDLKKRRKLYILALQKGLMPLAIVHPSSYISPSSKIGKGATILNNAIINVNAELGENVLINTGAIVEHDCIIGSHTHIAPGAVLCGNVTVGEGSFIGANSVVREKIIIGKDVVVGAGSVVVENIPDGITIVGNPGRRITVDHATAYNIVEGKK